jgi:hypothetical protein
VRAHLRTFLDRIVIYSDGQETELEVPRGCPKEVIKEHMPFLRDLQRRRNSKEGRFIDLVYKGGRSAEGWEGLALCPTDSVAFQDGSLWKTLGVHHPSHWTFQGRDLELWREWQTRNGD